MQEALVSYCCMQEQGERYRYDDYVQSSDVYLTCTWNKSVIFFLQIIFHSHPLGSFDAAFLTLQNGLFHFSIFNCGRSRELKQC